MRLGYLERKALHFISKCNGWISYASDADTERVISRLAAKNLVTINQFHQFKRV